MSQICVAHLVRKANGTDPFKAFLDSYRLNPAGVGHDLLFIFKGFDNDQLPQEFQALASDLPHRSCFVPDEGFDIASYFRAIRELDYDFFFPLNSFSVILDTGWLEKLFSHLLSDGVGIVGATGSYESHYTTNLHRWRYDRTKWIYRGALSGESKKIRSVFQQRSSFPAFPNPHLRTNAFLIRRKLLLSLKAGALLNKQQSHQFESGYDGMTRQILQRGLRPLVVGRDGHAYEVKDWRQSFTFRSGEQQNLLVSDNQTRHYQNADPQLRQKLIEETWGV
jgi:hypothetical protein